MTISHQQFRPEILAQIQALSDAIISARVRHSMLFVRVGRYDAILINLFKVESLQKNKDFWLTELELSQKKIDFGKSSISVSE